MRSLLSFGALCVCLMLQISLFAVTYTFIGGGPNTNFGNSNNWMAPNGAPPQTLPSGDHIIITSTCVLNVNRIIASGATLTINPGVSFTINSGRTLRIQGEFTSDGNITNNGTFTNQGESTSNGTFINNGLVNAASAASYQMNNNGSFTNNGSFIVGAGIFDNGTLATFTNNASATLTIKQGFFKNDGVLTNMANATIQAESDGTILGNLNNDGILSLSNNNIGTFTITGNYTSSSTSVLILDIRENNNGNPISDQLVIGGTATLNGTLQLIINNSNFIFNGDPFNLLIAGTVAGTFTTLDLPGIMMDWEATYDTDGLMLTYMGAPLPIELGPFTAQQLGTSILIKWETITEKENAYMAVERSKDGITFQEIGRRKGAGTTTLRQFYDFTDTTPLYGINYYRLRQVDADGKSTYHTTIAVEFGGKVAQGMQLFPTQTNENITVSLTASPTTGSILSILDANGKLVKQQNWSTEALQETINVSALSPGVYFITLQKGKTFQTLRFVRI